MEEYLRKSLKFASSGSCARLKAVMGNESGDLDSVISSLVYAYLLHNIAVQDTPVVPVLNFLEKELPLKTEVTYYLKKNGIPLDALTFRDTVDLRTVHKSGKLELVLMDHHVMSKETEILRTSVVQVIDHHPQDPAWMWPSETTTLKKVGSCCTLVAEKMLELQPKLLNCQVAALLYGPIVLDTACFNPAADKTTELDLQMAAELERRGVKGSQKDKLFADLLAARSDVSSLTPSQLLLKDMKVTSGVPMPGFPILVQEFVNRHGMLAALQQFCTEHNTGVTVLLGLKIDGDSIKRDLAVFNMDAEDKAEQMVSCLMKSRDPELLLEVVETQVPGLQLFNQLNVKASRKQILPVVKHAAQ
ncbi:hypothetical protein L9F63_007491, partial [Diploptera punctata]